VNLCFSSMSLCRSASFSFKAFRHQRRKRKTIDQFNFLLSRNFEIYVRIPGALAKNIEVLIGYTKTHVLCGVQKYVVSFLWYVLKTKGNFIWKAFKAVCGSCIRLCLSPEEIHSNYVNIPRCQPEMPDCFLIFVFQLWKHFGFAFNSQEHNYFFL
jgi:hypothetical protein